MKTRPVRTNLLTHLFLTILPLLPAITSQTTNLTTPSDAVNFACTPLRAFDLRLGLVHNCAAAILALPHPDQPVAFHTGGSEDIGRLPVSKNKGDCAVTVGLAEASELTTWTSIKLVASLLMTACTDTSLNYAYTGGFANAGFDERIKVSLQRFEGGVGNASSLLSD